MNLARCTRVTVVPGEHSDELRIVASDGGRVEEVRGEGLSREQADDAMFELAQGKSKAGRFKENGAFFPG